MKWALEEENQLRELFSTNRTEDIAVLMNKTVSQIENKSYKLKLKKTKEHRSSMISKRNKMITRDLSYEKLKEIALLYKTRGEFQRLDHSAYSTARTSGYLDDICSHMVKGTYSIPQLILYYIIKTIFINEKISYNTRKIISPYEIDVYIKKYNLGFEYDGKGWHNDSTLDNIKNKLCKDKNILLIRIIENNRKYEDDIKNQLIEKLKVINKRCKTTISADDITNISSNAINLFVNDQILDTDNIKAIIDKYENYEDFKRNENSLYQKLIKRKVLNLYTKDLKRKRIYWTIEAIKKEINKYDKLNDFITNSYGCYLYITRNNLSYLTDGLKKSQLKLTIDDVKKEISKYEYLKDFRNNAPKHYNYVERKKLYFLITNLKRER